MSRRQPEVQRTCNYTISGTNFNADKIKHELHRCGIDDVKVSPCGRNLHVSVVDPNPRQVAVINQYFDTNDSFPDLKDEFKKNNKNWNDWEWSDSFSF